MLKSCWITILFWASRVQDGSIAGLSWSLSGVVVVIIGALFGIVLFTWKSPALSGRARSLFAGSNSVVGARKPATSQLFVGPANKWLYETGLVISYPPIPFHPSFSKLDHATLFSSLNAASSSCLRSSSVAVAAEAGVMWLLLDAVFSCGDVVELLVESSVCFSVISCWWLKNLRKRWMYCLEVKSCMFSALSPAWWKVAMSRICCWMWFGEDPQGWLGSPMWMFKTVFFLL